MPSVNANSDCFYREPTLRLDLAPSLNWLTRRSVLASIHSNTLHIEQLHVATLFLESSAATYSYSPFGSGTLHLILVYGFWLVELVADGTY